MEVDIKGVDLACLSVRLSVPGHEKDGKAGRNSTELHMSIEELEVLLKALTRSDEIEITTPFSSSREASAASGEKAPKRNAILELKNRYQRISSLSR
jgi:hypothetical protein